MKQPMMFSRLSPLTNKLNILTLNLNPEDLRKWQQGDVLIQDAMPYLTPGEREFLITGYTEEDWDEIFSGGEDDYEE